MEPKTTILCGSRTCTSKAASGQNYCSITCAYDDAYDTATTVPTWIPVGCWDDIDFGTRIKAVVGEEVFVGLYFGVDDDDARYVSHLITSDTVGDLRFGGFVPDADTLFVEVRTPAECEARAARDIGESFAPAPEALNDLIARAAGVDPDVARRLGF